MMLKTFLALVLCTGPALCAAEPTAEPTAGPFAGAGWTMTRLDLAVRVENDPPSLRVQGEMTLQLDVETSTGPSLWCNTRAVAMSWRSLDGPPGSEVVLDATIEDWPEARFARVRLREPAVRDDEITLRFSLDKIEETVLFRAREDFCLASWTEAWYPVATVDPDSAAEFTASLISVPGATTLDLPGEWIALSDGSLASRESRDGRTVEVWEQGNRPVARSFSAGPYRAVVREVDGRRISIYLLSEHEIGAEDLVELLAASLAAQEARLGPYPFEGYGVAEVPNAVKEWGGASMQTFIMARSNLFDCEHGNLPLWAHEMCHGWWGNTVANAGPGSYVAGETLAHYGVLISAEALEGRDAMMEFLEFGRSCFGDDKCARGYFRIVDKGEDHPLATLGDSDLSYGTALNLADSKGIWVYHMLRQRTGDELFFATLRGLIAEYAERAMSLDDLRAGFIRAAGPEAELEGFFEQWLDRPGVPELELQWAPSSTSDGEFVKGSIRQIQPGKPYHLFVTLGLARADSPAVEEHVVELRSRVTEFSLDVEERVDEVVLDPGHDILMFRPEYGSASTAAVIWIVAAILAVAAPILYRRWKAGRDSAPSTPSLTD